jgi:lipopolysaccharide export system ATP-binding protein
MKSVLQVRKIGKSYNKRQVIKDISIFVQTGEIVGLLGPNGAGKTTSFYIACGLVTADEGDVFIDQENISNIPMHKRAKLGLAYLPQEASIFKKLSVEDNIMAVLEMRKDIDKKAKKQQLEELLKEFSLEKIRKSQGVSLSGGERRRTEIARCLAINPKFVLLDEPFAGVDPISVVDIQKIIYKLKDKNIGVLITDHNYREMLDTCDHSYVLSGGQIIAEGSKDEILYNETVRAVYLGDRTL